MIFLPGLNHRAALLFANNSVHSIMSDGSRLKCGRSESNVQLWVQTTRSTIAITAGELLRLAQEKAMLAKQAGGNTDF